MIYPVLYVIMLLILPYINNYLVVYGDHTNVTESMTNYIVILAILLSFSCVTVLTYVLDDLIHPYNKKVESKE
jgi:phage shock protein PspC (stress-responsive transcriptional regulator)